LGGEEYITIALLGKIKGETDDRAHLLPSVPITSSGVRIAESMKHVIDFKARNGFITGLAISDLGGQIYETSDMNDALLEVLEDVFENH
jgi:hypothetical protein